MKFLYFNKNRKPSLFQELEAYNQALVHLKPRGIDFKPLVTVTLREHF
jgi:hypothetical protein